MPKRNPKPKPDPLAKVSAPNLRRMVKRLQADERRLTRVCQSHHERYLQTLARVMELEADHGGVINTLFETQNDVASLRTDRDRLAAELVKANAEIERFCELFREAHNERVCLAAELAALKRTPLDAVDVTMAGDEGKRFRPRLPNGLTVADFDALIAALSEPPPDDAQATVVVNVPPYETEYWFARTITNPGEYADTRTTITPDNTPPEVQVPPFGAGMPGATLTPHEVFNPRVAWSWLYWDWRRSPLTCPAVADSLEGRAGVCNDGYIDNYYTTYTDRNGKANPVCMSEIYRVYAVRFSVPLGVEFYPLPPATWRQA